MLELMCGQCLRLYLETPGDYGERTLQYLTLKDEVCHNCECGAIISDSSERNYPCSGMICVRLGSKAENAADIAALSGAVSGRSMQLCFLNCATTALPIRGRK